MLPPYVLAEERNFGWIVEEALAFTDDTAEGAFLAKRLGELRS